MSSASPRRRTSTVHQITRFVASHNPFYAVSAGLVFYGLRLTFAERPGPSYSLILAGCLGAYVVLLALTAVVLRHFGTLWEDVRTLVVLVVLLFPAISVSFDDVLVSNPEFGVRLYFAGAAFAVVVSEGLIRALCVRLPPGYRIPYHLLLALFFLYPPLVAAHSAQPGSPMLQWLMFGFAPTVGAVLLSLLPAVRRGAAYASRNGTPWEWPLYPGTLFAVLVLCSVGRTYYLCRSFHFVGDREGIFAPYFYMPILLAVAAVVVVGAERSGSRAARRTALLLPWVAVMTSHVNPTRDVVFAEFMEQYREVFSTMPPAAALWGAAAFYGLATIAGVRSARSHLTAALLIASVVGPDTTSFDRLADPTAPAIGIAAMVELVPGLIGRRVGACLLGIGCSALFAYVGSAQASAIRWFVSYHVVIGMCAVASARLRGRSATAFRAAAVLLLPAATAQSLAPQRFVLFADLPHSAAAGYGFGASLFAATLAVATSRRLWHFGAWSVLGEILAWYGAYGYARLRSSIAGLDALSLGLASFAAAVFVSAAKARRLRRLQGDLRKNRPDDAGGRTSADSTESVAPIE